MVKQLRDAELVRRIKKIIAAGEHPATQFKGAGRAGALIEHLLGIDINNDPVPDAVNWEIKTSTSRASLLTLFHLSPSSKRYGNTMTPLVRNFGWPADSSYPQGTLSFRTTLSGKVSSRGFAMQVDNDSIKLAFNPNAVDPEHQDWLDSVQQRCGGKLDNPPTWTWDDLYRSAGAKLRNLLLVEASSRDNSRYITFHSATMLRDLKLSAFNDGLRNDWVKVDFDAVAKSAHKAIRDHGVKFRVAKSHLERLYETSEPVK